MKKETYFTHKGRPKAGKGTSVNPSITRASTLLFERSEDLYTSDARSYGRHGAEVHDQLKTLFNELEDGSGTTLVPSGLAACTLPILAKAKAGDHILLTDSAYGPTRYFCDNFLKKMNIETEIYNPRIGADISKLIRKNTSVICLESPGSLTLEIQDIPAICEIAKAKKITTIVDNTWSAGLTLNPLKLGADISVHAATKFFGGHSDILFGAVISRSATIARQVELTAKYLGNATSPDDAYQILRGFRTVAHRFKAQEKTSYELASFLAKHKKIAQVIHPALEQHPDHALWKRDFTGGGALFSVVLKPCTEAEVHRFINRLKYFGIGFSYGGYESLVIYCDPQLKRKYDTEFGGPVVRFACGLEHLDDLKEDLDQALNALELS